MKNSNWNKLEIRKAKAVLEYFGLFLLKFVMLWKTYVGLVYKLIQQ